MRLLRTCKLALHLAYVFLFQLLHSTLAPPQLPPGKVYGKFPLLRFSKYARYALLLPWACTYDIRTEMKSALRDKGAGGW